MVKKGFVQWAFRLGVGDELLVSGKKEVKVGQVIAKTSKAEFTSPVDGKIIVKGDRVVLKFKAIRFCGRGLGGGKSWGRGIKIVDKREELTFEDQKKVIIDRTGDAAVGIKAKSVGASGMVVASDTINSYLPTVGLIDSELKKISEYVDKKCRIWINGESGRIFVVL